MELVDVLNRFFWGLLKDWVCFVGVFLTLGLNFVPLRLIGFSCRNLWLARIQPQRLIASAKGSGDGEINAWNAFMVTLGGTVGAGNLAGTALAISIGGPGSLAWMWIVSLIGLSLKFSETFLAVQFRHTTSEGTILAGPMQTIRKGLPRQWAWLGSVFAAVTLIAEIGPGNGLQVQQVANAMGTFGTPRLLTGVVVASLTAVVISGGLRRIGRVSALLVPLMVLGYGLGMGSILVLHHQELPTTIQLILQEAFQAKAMAGASLGLTISEAVRMTVFSTELGRGTSAIIQATSRPADPLLQGGISMLQNLIDTTLCSATGLIVICSGSDTIQASGFDVLQTAMAWASPDSLWITDLATVLFSFTTILTASVYGERCLIFLCGARAKATYRWLWCSALILFAAINSDWLWRISELLQGLEVLPNLLVLLMLSPFLFKSVAKRLQTLKQGRTLL